MLLLAECYVIGIEGTKMHKHAFGWYRLQQEDCCEAYTKNTPRQPKRLPMYATGNDGAGGRAKARSNEKRMKKEGELITY